MRDFGTIGGEEMVALGIGEMPKHEHIAGYIGVKPLDGGRLDLADPQTPGFINLPYWVDGSRDRRAESSDGIVGFAGSGQAHENMPPYFALYWCKKD